MKKYRGKIPIRYRLHEGYRVDPVSGCWLWQGYINTEGYGQIPTGGKSNMAPAHRYYYEALVGPVPEGHELDHLCRNRPCVNPGHLEPVTKRENVLRGDGPTAVNARKTHCVHGHALTEDNIYRRGPDNRQRSCRTCAIRRAKEHKAKLRARRAA